MTLYSCICGSIIKYKQQNKHFLTKKHNNFINNNELMNKKSNTINESKTINEQQLAFINNNIENCVVYGNPGCGKTKSIIEYCINKKVKSNEFLIISYSKKAQLDFIKRGKTNSNIFNNNNVRTIHSLASTILKKIYNKSSDNINTIILATLKNIENEDISIVSCLSKCKFIIVDESQDINENQYNLIKLISTKLNISLILVGDPNQNIYQFQGGNDKFLLEHSNKQFNLVKNYRSTKQIIDFCNFIRPHNLLPLMEPENNKDNVKPLIYCESVDNILLHIKNEILNKKYKLHEIAIIGPVKLSKINKSIGLQQISNYLYKNNIKFIKHYKDSESIDFDKNENIQIEEDHVNILTSHGSKGLEFKKVLVVNYHFTTFSKIPSESEYNNFKYLWYVTLTRAIDKMVIYVDSEKYIFPEINKIPKEYYIQEGLPFKETKLFFDNNKQLKFSIVDLINNNKYFNENKLYEFENKFKYTVTTNNLYDCESHNNEIFEFNKYSCLYGKYIEELFTFYYYKNNYDINEYIFKCKAKINNKIIVKKNKLSIVKNLIKKGYILKESNILILDFNNINKLDLKTEEYEFILYCKKQIKNDDESDEEYITIIIENNLFDYDGNKLKNMYNSLINNINQEKIIFDIVLYNYQIENECRHILNDNFEEHINSIEQYFDKINELSKNKNNYKFQVVTENKHLSIVGIMDILYNDNTIIELKFCKNFNIKHILQVLLYNNNYNFKNNMEIWNLYDGKQYIINFEFNIWDFNCYLSDVLQIQMKNNIFILDIETNNKDIVMDFTNPFNAEIIDRFIYEYNFNTVISDGLIKNKFPLTTSHINGITEKDLLNAEPNYDKFKDDINKILKYCDKPIFIAHNGNRFDFPMLYHHEILNKYKISTIDTLYLFRLYYKEKNISNKLIDIYNKICDKNITQVHKAKEDTLLIVEILKKLKFSVNDLNNIIKQ